MRPSPPVERAPLLGANVASVTDDEIRAAIRSQGIADIKDALAVVLETDGILTVLRDNATVQTSSLTGVSNYPADTVQE